MDKYLLLFLFNAPFSIFGLIKAASLYRHGSIRRFGLLMRMVFWLTILAGLLFANTIYDFLLGRRLTDSAPLSLADVVLTTGVIFCFFLCTRLYSKLDATERRLSDLHERLSIELSKDRSAS